MCKMERKAKDWVNSINQRDLQRHRADGENYKKSAPPLNSPQIKYCRAELLRVGAAYEYQHCEGGSETA